MAKASGTKKSNSQSNRTRTTKSKKRYTTAKKTAADYRKENELFEEIGLIVFFILMVILFLCNFGIIGPVGETVSSVLFGIFGLTAYIMPIVLFGAVMFWYANRGSVNAVRKLISGIVLFFMAGIVCDLLFGNGSDIEAYNMQDLYEHSVQVKSGGGVLAGSISFILCKYLGSIGTVLVVLLCSAISFILITEHSLINGVKDGGSRILTRSREDSERRREYALQRRMEQEELRARRMEERDERLKSPVEGLKGSDERLKERQSRRQLKIEEKENEKILRMDKKVTGIADTTLPKKESRRRDDIHEIVYQEHGETDHGHMQEINMDGSRAKKAGASEKAPEFDFDKIRIRSAHQVTVQEIEKDAANGMQEITMDASPMHEREMEKIRYSGSERVRPVAKAAPLKEGMSEPDIQISKDIEAAEKKKPKTYIFPPLSRLQKGSGRSGDSTDELKDTALRLQQTLHTFGVNVTITDISQGPSVTRYELQPEQGVKVSKILSLADDIKLNLAATDIRIEAPIPGKAAIGIEVPNKENMTVALRDLLESREFREFKSNIAFAVGKDIGGQTIVTDIAKMPHMLIAGSTGSGKSVCINTLIMSILYKAHPDDVKLIMVDPKVVELSVYNGIPHLMIPVVTDPKKASAALHWAVSEMTERYKKFADFNVRDLKGYNQKVESMREIGDETAPAKMPQIVIIVDELADLMMVSPGEVEESICRLAQLARAAGIHLIIATQRPSVDVITGLIKANMPSRVAFAVSSGVDSRTILDMNGAEKLLGKGDMLFYPQGYTKPARIQGAFVSDKEVSDVVDFLKNQAIGNTYAEDIEEQIKKIGNGSGGSSSAGGGQGDGLDEYFADAGRFIIDKDKASIGMLQRVFKIGFNRAARIMDQLCEHGVVGEEEGTKPRKILMSTEEFEQLLEEI